MRANKQVVGIDAKCDIARVAGVEALGDFNALRLERQMAYLRLPPLPNPNRVSASDASQPKPTAGIWLRDAVRFDQAAQAMQFRVSRVNNGLRRFRHGGP